MSIASSVTPSFPKLEALPDEPAPSWEVALLFPRQGQWNQPEYLSLVERTNRMVELSEGNIKVIEMPTESHQDILMALQMALQAYASPRRLGKVSFAGLPVKLWSDQFREPDVVFMLAEHSERRHEQYWEGADLAMEVVSSDRRHDLQVKREEYARSGIPEYWIVDPLLKEITVLKLAGSSYEEAGVYRVGQQAASALLPGFSVDVAAVFDAK
jgi:Uma2 family endonuclease